MSEEPVEETTEGPAVARSTRLPVQRLGDSVTTGSLGVVTEEVGPGEDEQGAWIPLLRVVLVLASGILVGALAGPLWRWVTPLETFTLTDTFSARTTEAGWNAVFAPDFTAAVIGLGAGLLIGVLGVLVGMRLGWWVTLVTCVAAVLGFAAMAGVGYVLGPPDDVHAVASAVPGDVVSASLRPHTWVTAAVWTFAALVPPVVWAVVGGDPERLRPVRLDAVASEPAAETTSAER